MEHTYLCDIVNETYSYKRDQKIGLTIVSSARNITLYQPNLTGVSGIVRGSCQVKYISNLVGLNTEVVKVVMHYAAMHS